MHDIAAAAASPVFGVPLSVLDVAPVSSDRSPVEALADSTALVQEAERLGYHRLWYAEHHNMPGIASRRAAGRRLGREPVQDRRSPRARRSAP